MADSFPPSVGERFADRYELTTKLRGGGAAHAFLAHDHHAGRDVDLVLFHPACAHPNAWRAFAQTIAAAGEAKVTGLVLPRNVGSAPPVPPYCLGEPQMWQGFDRLRDKGPTPWLRALFLGERVAEILEKTYAATRIAHRALLPGRCVVSRDEVKVLDFGVAELVGGLPDDSPYRAPEQSAGPGDARSDVYALAVILFELMTGEPCAKGPLPRLRSRVAAPQSVDDFLARALAPEPAQRHADVAAMRAAMRELGSGAPAEPQIAGAPTPGKSAPAVARVEAQVLAGPAAPGKSAAPQVPGNVVAPGKSAEPRLPGGVAAPAVSGAPAPAGKPVPSPVKPQATPLEPRREPARIDPLPVAPAVVPLVDVTEVLAPVRPSAAPVADRTEVLPPASAPRVAAAVEASVDPPTEKMPVPVRVDTTLALPEEPREPSTVRFARGFPLPSKPGPSGDPEATEVYMKPVRRRDVEVAPPADITLAVPQRPAPASEPGAPSDITYFMPSQPAPAPAPVPAPLPAPVPAPPPVAAETWSLQKILIVANVVFAALIVIALLINLAM